jgi:hypothetical protein
MRDRCDQLFRHRIRERDKVCQAVGMYELGCSPIQEVAHFFPRRALSVRWDESNACLLCFFHHRFLDTHPIEKWEFVKERLGPELDALRKRYDVVWHKDYDAVIAGLK